MIAAPLPLHATSAISAATINIENTKGAYGTPPFAALLFSLRDDSTSAGASGRELHHGAKNIDEFRGVSG